jgi:hypothetical protein
MDRIEENSFVAQFNTLKIRNLPQRQETTERKKSLGGIFLSVVSCLCGKSLTLREINCATKPQ